MLKNTADRYGRISIANHWLLALLMISMLILGLILDDMARGPDKRELIALHKSIGIVALFFGIWGFIWRLAQHSPDPVEGTKNWEKSAARFSHVILLAGILIMPISGYIMSTASGRELSVFGLFTMPQLIDSEELGDIADEIHGIFPNILMAVILFHAAAALKHHFIDKDSTLKRMFGKS